jgi:hypothetical protein
MEIAEMKPISGKASAGNVGANGAALAVVLIKNAEAQASKEVKRAESQKDTLARLLSFTRDDHLEFRAHLETRRSEIKRMADGAGVSLRSFIEADPYSASIQSTVSLWLKMSETVELGWKPNLSSCWADISMSATEARNSKSVPNTNGVTAHNPIQRKAGRKPKAALDKAKQFISATIVDKLGTKEAAIKPDVNLCATVEMMLQPATLKQMREVAAMVERLLQQKEAEAVAMESAAKVTAKAKRSSAKAKQSMEETQAA